MRSAVGVLVAWMTLTCGACDAGKNNNTTEVLQKTSYWFVENGMSVYGEKRNTAAVLAKVNSMGPKLRAEVLMEKSDASPGEIPFLPYYSMLFMGFGNQVASVECFQRMFGKTGSIYEYWLIRVGNLRGSSYIFLLTKSSSLYAKREIEFTSEKFVAGYTYKDEIGRAHV